MALYHEHRPQSFDAVLGQEHIIETIKNQIATGKTAHAYLFSGPRGVGKTTTARVLSKALNCKERKAGSPEPCNACSSCQEISASRAIDVIEIDAASHTGVDNVRENIIENAQFRPTSSLFKVFIVDEVHMLSTSAFNALLKTLEEPPSHVVFILATTEMDKLPATIISRCQRFQFKKIPFVVLTKHLLEIAKDEKVKVDDEVIDRIVRKSDGCARDAVGLLDQIMATGEKHITPAVASLVMPTSANEDVVGFVSACLKGETEAGLALLSDLYDRGIQMTQFLNDVTETLRTLLLGKVSGKMETELKELAPLAGAGELIALIDIVMKRKLEVRSSPIPTLPAELVLFEWAERGRTDTTATLKPQTEVQQSQSQSETKIKAKIEITDTKVEKIADVKTSGAVSLDFIQKIWPDFLLKVEKTSPSLVFILKMADFKEVDGRTVVLAVQYTFHRDKILHKSCQRQLEELLSQTAGHTLRLDAVVVPGAPRREDEEDAEGLALLLGGEVV